MRNCKKFIMNTNWDFPRALVAVLLLAAGFLGMSYFNVLPLEGPGPSISVRFDEQISLAAENGCPKEGFTTQEAAQKVCPPSSAALQCVAANGGPGTCQAGPSIIYKYTKTFTDPEGNPVQYVGPWKKTSKHPGAAPPEKGWDSLTGITYLEDGWRKEYWFSGFACNCVGNSSGSTGTED